MPKQTKNKQQMDSDLYLDKVLQQRDKEIGIGGEYTFSLEVKHLDRYINFLQIPNLTKQAVQNLFDLIDENNHISDIVDARIRILKDNREIDLNLLPNGFSTQIHLEVK